MLRLGETLIPIQNLPGQAHSETLSGQTLLVVEKDQQPTALTIDELIGQQQVVIRPLQGFLTGIPLPPTTRSSVTARLAWC